MNIILQGLGASVGIAEGLVKIIQSESDFEKMDDGDILVANVTDPSMVGVMQKAIAIITNHGGIGSHAAIVARELGIPCVVGTNNATKVLKDKLEVVVDGRQGIVYAKD